MDRLDELKKRLKRQEDIYYEHYEDEEAFIPDLLDEADSVIDTQRLIIREYKKLEEQGRLVKLPCKIGDTVYCLYRNCIEKKTRVIEPVIDYFEICNGWIGIVGFVGENDEYRYLVEEIGKTVFLTREEAEAKLKEMEK